MESSDTLTRVLNNGNSIPSIGLGTYQMKGDEVKQAVRYALEVGYIHIDSAAVYRNEADIGAVFTEDKIPREKIFVTTKIPPTAQGFEEAYALVETSLKKFNFEYLDLVLIHWPGASKTPPTSDENLNKRQGSWRALEKLYEEGKVKNIGVSNYYVNHLETLLKTCKVKPQINQFELHPMCIPTETVEYCKDNNIQIEAYSSLGRHDPKLVENAVVVSTAQKYGKSVSQLLLRWSLDQGYVVLPKSRSKARIVENFAISDFKLEDQDITALNDLNQNMHTCWDPTNIA